MIKSLTIKNVRCLQDVKVKPASCLNIIYGGNGSGKTSILEAISILGGMKSFRSGQISDTINHESDALTVVSDALTKNSYNCYRLGISRYKDKKKPDIKINGKNIYSVSELTNLLPIQTITSDSFQLIEGSSKYRRGLLDWGLFHVKHSLFFPLWQKIQKAINQRNILLKTKPFDSYTMSLIESWNKLIAETSTKIDDLRKQYFSQLKPIFYDVIEKIKGIPDFNISYYRGWDEKKTIYQALQDSLDRDIKQGYTSLGVHKADIAFELNYKGNNKKASKFLSRGQIKLIVYAFKISQALLLKNITAKKSIFLLDDLPAELEEQYVMKVVEIIKAAEFQTYITCIEAKQIQMNLTKSTKSMFFFVEHGKITEQQMLKSRAK